MTEIDVSKSNGSSNEDALAYYTRIINDLNDSFHHNYHKAIQRSHKRLGKEHTPAIVVSGDHVSLFHKGQQVTELIIPKLYEQVKSISHLSFGVYVTLANNGIGPLDEDLHADLAYALELIEQGQGILDKLDIPRDFMALQRDTLKTAEDIVRHTLDTRAVDEKKLQEFGRVSAPLYLDNAALAAKLELDELHKVISRWKEQIGKEDWDKTYVVICAAHQARYRETTKQYFQKLLHEEEERLDANYENRVVYAEHIYDIDTALDLLARHLVDRKASVALFGSRTRLQEDLMSDGADEYLRVLFDQ